MAVSAILTPDLVKRVFPDSTPLSVYPTDLQSVYGDPQGLATATGIAVYPGLADPGFETSVDSWGVYEATGTGAALASETTVVRTGGKSAKVTAGTGDSAAGVTGPTDTVDQVQIVEDETLAVSVYCRSAVGTPNASVTISWTDGTDVLSTEAGDATALVAGEWVELTAAGVAPANTVAALFTVAIADPADASVYYVDDVSVLASSDPELTTITGLEADTEYTAWGQVAGVWRRLGFRSPVA